MDALGYAAMVADENKVANQLTLKSGHYSGFSRLPQRNHKDPQTRKREERGGQHDAMWGEADLLLLALKMEQKGQVEGRWLLIDGNDKEMGSPLEVLEGNITLPTTWF